MTREQLERWMALLSLIAIWLLVAACGNVTLWMVADG